VLEVSGLVKRFGGFTAVNNVSFAVEQGEILGLIGPNGSGKSTIFNMLSGTLAPTAGSIRFHGREIAGRPPHRIINSGVAVPSKSLGRSIGCLCSTMSRSPDITARGDTREPMRLPRRSGHWRWSVADRQDDSGGRPRCGRAQETGSGPRRWLPNRASCSPTRAWAGWTRLRWTRRRTCCRRIRTELGITIIWVEHIMGVLMRVVDRVMVLDHGEKIAEGLPAAVAADRGDRGLSGYGRRRGAGRGCRPRLSGGIDARTRRGRCRLREPFRPFSASRCRFASAKPWQ